MPRVKYARLKPKEKKLPSRPKRPVSGEKRRYFPQRPPRKLPIVKFGELPVEIQRIVKDTLRHKSRRFVKKKFGISPSKKLSDRKMNEILDIKLGFLYIHVAASSNPRLRNLLEKTNNIKIGKNGDLIGLPTEQRKKSTRDLHLSSLLSKSLSNGWRI